MLTLIVTVIYANTDEKTVYLYFASHCSINISKITTCKAPSRRFPASPLDKYHPSTIALETIL